MFKKMIKKKATSEHFLLKQLIKKKNFTAKYKLNVESMIL